MKTKKVDRLQDLINLVEKLREEISDLKRQLAEKDLIIADLQNRLNKNSQNSSKPPSTDFFRKPKSERSKSGKNAGGQKGHAGSTLKQVENPDVIQKHDVSQCNSCQHDLSSVTATYEKRQIIDIPPVKAIITEHQFASKKCPKCKIISAAKIPAELTQQIQYGSKITSLASYLHYVQFIPYDRISETLSDLFSVSISKGTLVSMHETMFVALEKHESLSRAELLKSLALYFDETGFAVKGDLNWVHVASTPTQTVYFPHPKRGTEAIEAFNILPLFSGIVHHDHWKPYFKFKNVTHALCNAHHLRELKAMLENYGQQWAKKMYDHLKLMNKHVLAAKELDQFALKTGLIIELEQKYDEILQEAKPELPIIATSGKRGKQKQHPAKNLHDRLTKYKSETIRFMRDFTASFTNNQAERDIRMVKVKQKISGGFRSMKGAGRFCRIRGQISTFKKQQKNVFHAFATVIQEHAFQNLSPGA